MERTTRSPVASNEKQPPIKLLYTVNEAAQALSLSRAFLYRLMQRGELASLKLDGVRRITWRQLQAFVERLESDNGGLSDGETSRS